MEIYLCTHHEILRKVVHWDSIESLIPNYEIRYSKKIYNGKKVFMCVSTIPKNPNIVVRPLKRNNFITNLLCAKRIINVQMEYQNLGVTDINILDDFTQRLMSHNKILSQLSIQYSNDPSESQILGVILEHDSQLEIMGTVAIVACLNDRLVDLEMDELSEYLSMFLK